MRRLCSDIRSLDAEFAAVTATPESADGHLWVSWQDYYGAIERLCLLLDDSAWKFDQILCLARGGLRVGDVISRVFGRPLAILATSSYRDFGGTAQGELEIAPQVTSTAGPLRGRLLVVDDLVDSGVTLDHVCQHLRTSYAEIVEVRTAVLWWKGCSRFAPDFYVTHLEQSPWIHQPFEEYDTMDPAALRARRAALSALGS